MPWRGSTIDRARILAILVIGLTAVGCGTESMNSGTGSGEIGSISAGDPDSSSTKESASLEQRIQQIRLMMAKGRSAEAETAMRDLLVGNGDDTRLQILVGDVLQQQNKFSEAASWALEMSTDEPQGSMSLGWLEKAYFWSLDSGDWASAEQIARLAIERFPEQPKGYRYLARLLSSQGRRQEASQSVHKLLTLGVADPREILSLVDVSGPFQLVSFERWTNQFDKGLFALGQARQKYIGDNDSELALELVQKFRSDRPGDPDVEAFYGRLLAETNRNELLTQWFDSIPDGIEELSEYWLTMGIWLQNNDQDLESIGALTRAIEINPTDRKALRLVVAALTRLGQDKRAAGVQATLSKLDTVFRKAAFADATEAFQIGATLESMMRPWEALGWYTVAIQRGAGGSTERQKLAERAAAIRKWQDQATAKQILQLRTKKLLGFDPADYPLPESLVKIARKRVPVENIENKTLLAFRDVAVESGIRTTFISDYNLENREFYLHQANGGGLAFLDYDRDGRADVYVVQSGGDPNRLLDSAPNELYRQTGDVSFSSVERHAGCDGRGFGQGVCAADINQDGFVDLLIANIGRNQMLINQGDGTFRDVSETHFPAVDNWTSSIGVGDLNSDQLPDIVEVNYIDDPQIFAKKCQGRLLACVPQDFRAAADRFLRGVGDGRFVANDSIAGDSVPRNYGFGVVIANFDGQAGNEVFIGNDGDLNHYWRHQSTTEGAWLIESANISGNAIGAAGVSEACMGIASGDFDHNGRLDLAVTNFYKEPLNLFLQSRSGAFVDDAMRRGLDLPSRSVLGFGCQATDLDNDGWLDLSLLNGHLYDFREDEIPFQMKPQLFRGSKNAFVLQQTNDQAPYFTAGRLGRTLATGDINQDGRMDLLANHLDAPLSLLLNESESGNWLQIELVGRDSERDAVGAIVALHCGDRTFNAWQTGGDGYMCTNESILHFGIGDLQQIDQLTIAWPSGKNETIDHPPINHRILIVEGLGFSK